MYIYIYSYPQLWYPHFRKSPYLYIKLHMLGGVVQLEARAMSWKLRVHGDGCVMRCGLEIARKSQKNWASTMKNMDLTCEGHGFVQKWGIPQLAI